MSRAHLQRVARACALWFLVLCAPALASAAVVSVPTSTTIGLGSTLSVPVSIDDATGLEAGDIWFTYNSALVSVPSAPTVTALTAACTLVSNLTTPGVVKLSLACPGPLTGSGDLVSVPFQANVVGTAAVAFTRCSLNEDAISCTTSGGSLVIPAASKSGFGCYTGDGTDDRQIALGFQPDWVLVLRQDASVSKVGALRNSAWGTGDKSCPASSTSCSSFATDQIQALNASGFQVGTDAEVNTAAATYCYYAVSGSGTLAAVGQYTGDGTTMRSITVPFTPRAVFVLDLSSGGSLKMRHVVRTSTMPAGYAFPLESDDPNSGYLGYISSLGVNSFVVEPSLNVTGQTYAYLALKADATFFDNGTYTAASLGTFIPSACSGGPAAVGVVHTQSGSPLECEAWVNKSITLPYRQLLNQVDSADGITTLNTSPSGYTVTSRCTQASTTYHWWAFCNAGIVAAPTTTPTPLLTSTPTQTYTVTDTPTVTETATDTPTVTATGTITLTPTITNTPANTFTSTPANTGTATWTPTATGTPLPVGIPQAAYGCYTGNGVDDRLIYTAFQPDDVYVLALEQGPVDQHWGSFRASEFGAGDKSCRASNTTCVAPFLTNQIQELTADGFKVGTDDEVNRSGRTYCYWAWKGNDSSFAHGEYTGNGAGVRSITTPFQPQAVIVADITSGGNSYQRQVVRTADMPTNVAIGNEPFETSFYNDFIRQFGATSFEVGANRNVSGARYVWLAFREDTGFLDIGTYSGDGNPSKQITTTCQPKSVWLFSRQDPGTAECIRVIQDDPAVILPYGQAFHAFDKLYYFNSINSSPPGFTVVGHGDTRNCNESGKDYYYLAWCPPVPLTSLDCPGDCDGNLIISSDDLALVDQIIGGSQPLSACPSADANGNGVANLVDRDLILAAQAAGCPGAPPEDFQPPQYWFTVPPTFTPTPAEEFVQPIYVFEATDTPTPSPVSFPVSPTVTPTPADTNTVGPTPTATYTPPICSEYHDLLIQDNPRVLYRMNDKIGTLFVRDWMNRDDGLVPPGDVTTVETPRFAQGCYEGSGNDDRWIPVGLTNPGLLMIQKKGTAFETLTPMVYWIPEFGTASDYSCYAIFGTPLCDTNRIQAVDTTNGAFQLGTDDFVNKLGTVYCWSWWQLGDNHGTFHYTGDGTSTRSIPLGTQPDFVGLQLPYYAPFTPGEPFGKGNFYVRQVGQPAGESFGWYNVGEGARTNVITDLTATGFDVGDDANDSGKDYYGFWFKGSEGWGGPVSWTGDGNSGAGCASGSDVKTIASPCSPPRNVITSGCQVAGCGGGTCATHTGVASIVRGTNISNSFASSEPGYISGSDFYGLTSYGWLIGYLGTLSTNTFQVTGGVSFDKTLNDLGQTYYGFVTCAPEPPPIGIITAPGYQLSTIAAWENEQQSGDASPNSGGVACGANCDLSNSGVTRDTTNKLFGNASALFDANTDYLGCVGATCSNLNIAGSATFFAFIRPTQNTDSRAIMEWTHTDPKWSMVRSGTSITCGVSPYADAGAATTLNQWQFVACVFDDGANTLQTMLENTFSAGTAVPSMGSTTAGEFRVGYDGTIGWVGNIDQMGVAAGVWTQKSLCKVASCGVTGAHCSCYAAPYSDVYADTGLNSTIGANCDLPPCDDMDPYND